MKLLLAALASSVAVCSATSMAQTATAPEKTVAMSKSVPFAPPATEDISRDVVDGTIARLPTAADFGEWGYAGALFMMGDLSVYRRTHDPKYLNYAKAWVDLHLNSDGNFDKSINTLDYIMPGSVLIELYQATGDKKYERGAEKIYAVFKDYSRTNDGGFWHAENGHRDHQLWLDGTYMATPFIVRAGALFGQSQAADEEAVKQLLVYEKHLKDPKGPLFYHAYDESGKEPWADPTTHRSSIKWGRAIGWYCMAIVDVLDGLPQHPTDPAQIAERQQLLKIVQQLAHDLVLFQDPSTGLWFQIVDQPTLPGNFLETSCSSMYTYFLDISIKRGYVDASYRTAVDRGRRGVLSKLVADADHHPHITDISEGTNVAELPYYLGRKRNTDDFHGLGAFVLMNEELQFNQAAMQLKGFSR